MDSTRGTRTVRDVIRARCEARPEALAAVFPAQPAAGLAAPVSFTRGSLDRAARALAARLDRSVRGRPVVLLLPPGPTYLKAFLACVYAGVPAVPVYPPAPGGRPGDLARVRAVLDRLPDAVLLTEPPLRESLRALLDGERTDAPPRRFLGTDAPLSTADGWRPPPLGPEDVLFLQFTSGSTGDPKAAVVTHAALLANVAAITERFGLDRSSTAVLWLPPYHDMGLVGGLLTPLLTGFPIHLLAPQTFLADPLAWLRLCSETGATHTGAPDFGYALTARRAREAGLRADALDLSSLRVAFCGAEPVRSQTLAAFAETFAPAGFRSASFLPCYGLAENTLIVTGGRPGAGARVLHLDADALAAGRAVPAPPGVRAVDLVSAGPPVADTRILVADPATGAPREPGEVGEVFVRSGSVAAGYHESPEATRATFGLTVAGTGDGWLRTGDLGFLSADGELVPVGRIKDVIVVRGRTVHPQDLELTAQQAHPAVRPGCVAAVAVPGDDGGEEVLVIAELRGGHADDAGTAAETAAAIRKAVAGGHSVPVHAVHLIRPSTLPKTSSGKVQRSAARAAHLRGTLDSVLCDTDAAPTAARAGGEGHEGGPATGGAPALTARQQLAEQFAGTLIAHVGGDGTTRDLDSLAAARLVAVIADVFQVAVPIEPVLAGVDAARLAELIGSAPPAPAGPGTGARSGPAESPATPRQQALCLLQEVDAATPGLVLGTAFALPDGTTVADAGRAVLELTDRHEALRTRLVRRGEGWVKVVDPPGAATAREDGEPPECRSFTVTRLAADAVPDTARLAEVLRERCRRVPDLTAGPLFHVEAVLADGHAAHLVVRLHHAIADLWSTGVLAAEMTALLSGRGLPPATPPAAADTAAGLRHLERTWQEWADAYEQTPPLQLPPAPEGATGGGTTAAGGTAGAPPADGTPARETVHAALALGARRTIALRALADRCGTTLYATLLAVQAVVLARLTGADRVPVAVPLHGRSAATFHAVDYLVSTVPVPVDTATGTVAEMVARTSEQVRSALARRTVGYPELVAHSAAVHGPAVPAPDAALLLQQDTPGAPAGLAGALLGTGGLPLGNHRVPVAVPLPSVGPFGLASLLWEEAGAGGGTELTGRVEVDPGRHPAWLAARFADAFLAVADALAEDAGRPVAEVTAVRGAAAERLRRWSVSPVGAAGEDTLHGLVAAAVRRHPRRPAVVDRDGTLTYAELDLRSGAVAAGLRRAGAGPGSTVGVLLPRGKDLPAALLGVLRAGAAYVPFDTSAPPARLAAVLEDAGCRCVLTSAAFAAVDRGLPVRTLVLERLDPVETPPPDPGSTPDDPAYVLFTSGSTGRPKGVVIPHRGAANLIGWAGGVFTPAELAMTLAVTPATFDLSVFEMFVPLAHGGSVIMLGSALDLADTPPHAAGATLLNTVPSAVAGLLEQGALPAGLRVVNMAGEPLPAELTRAVHRAVPGVRVFNLYGPSETTTYSTYAELGPGTVEPVPIGRPVGGTSLAVVDAALRPVPPGGTGELLISGAGAALGYAGRAGMTAARFLPDPHAPGERRYRTGDLVRWRPDGQLEFVGRTDHQVKVRGFRIELGDVEQALRAVEPGRDVAVMAVGEGRARRLAAYLAPPWPGDADQAEQLRGVRSRLARELPGYMIPTEYAVLDQLPRNRHAKLDRAKLLATPMLQLVSGARVAPRTDTERRIADCWAAVLGGDPGAVGVTDSFLDAGGHSLLLARLAHLLGKEFEVDVPLAELWHRPTVAEQAELLAAAGLPAAAPAPLPRLDRSRFRVSSR